MGFDISNEAYLLKLKIDLSTEMGGTDVYVELREPSKSEYLTIAMPAKRGDEEGAEKAFAALLPALITGHSFMSGSNPASVQQVAAAINKKMPAAIKVEREFMDWANAPFLKKNEGK